MDYGMLVILVIVLILGAYSIISTIRMKNKGVVPKWMLKGYLVKEENDVDAFISYMFMKNICLGVVIFCYGLYSLMSHLVMKITVPLAVNIVFLLFLLAYFWILSGAKIKFLTPSR